METIKSTSVSAHDTYSCTRPKKYRDDRAGVFCGEIVDWLNSHHFDFKGLIPMGLAIKVTEENNPYKE